MSDTEQVLQIHSKTGAFSLARRAGPAMAAHLGRRGNHRAGSSDYDTAGHGMSADIDIDVAGHAMTLRLPTPADAQALRRLLMVSAMSATIVAAGAVASLQPGAVPIRLTPSSTAGLHRHRMQDFQERRETQIDAMLGAPAAAAPADNMSIERGQHGGAANRAGSSTASSASGPAVRPGRPSDDFAQRRETRRMSCSRHRAARHRHCPLTVPARQPQD